MKATQKKKKKKGEILLKLKGNKNWEVKRRSRKTGQQMTDTETHGAKPQAGNYVGNINEKEMLRDEKKNEKEN